MVEDKFIKWYRPASGFALNAKFMEEQDAPLAAFFVCQDRNTKRRSGKVTLSLKKGTSLVKNLFPLLFKKIGNIRVFLSKTHTFRKYFTETRRIYFFSKEFDHKKN